MPPKSPDASGREVKSFRDYAQDAEQAGRADIAAAIQLSDKIARCRDSLARVSLEGLASAEELVDRTASMRIELAGEAQELNTQKTDGIALPYRIGTHITMQAIFMDQLVLTPALFSYGPEDEEARAMRQVLNAGLHGTASSYAQSVHNEVPIYGRSKEDRVGRPKALREATVLAIATRAENPDEQILPTLFATDRQITQAEYFGFGSTGTVQHVGVHTVRQSQFTSEIAAASGLAIITGNDLGLGADHKPWGGQKNSDVTLTALKYEQAGEGHVLLGTNRIVATEGVLQIQSTVSGLLRSKLHDYDFTKSTVPPL